ncbi:MAG: cysteine-rich CWC family protein [Chitinophagaceae bacterium]
MCRHERKSCPQCKTVFECKPGNVLQCHCYGIAITHEQKAYIAQRYADCLCRNCLEYLSDELNLFKEKYIFR